MFVRGPPPRPTAETLRPFHEWVFLPAEEARVLSGLVCGLWSAIAVGLRGRALL